MDQSANLRPDNLDCRDQSLARQVGHATDAVLGEDCPKPRDAVADDAITQQRAQKLDVAHARAARSACSRSSSIGWPAAPFCPDQASRAVRTVPSLSSICTSARPRRRGPAIPRWQPAAMNTPCGMNVSSPCRRHQDIMQSRAKSLSVLTPGAALWNARSQAEHTPTNDGSRLCGGCRAA